MEQHNLCLGLFIFVPSPFNQILHPAPIQDLFPKVWILQTSGKAP